MRMNQQLQRLHQVQQLLGMNQYWNQIILLVRILFCFNFVRLLICYINRLLLLTEKKSVRELAASLIKQSKESPDNQRKSEIGKI